MYSNFKPEKLLQRAEPNRQVTIIYNLQGAGLAQSGLEFSRQFVFFTTQAYPNLLKRLLIIDLPWVLKSVWAIVKMWLTEHQKS